MKLLSRSNILGFVFSLISVLLASTSFAQKSHEVVVYKTPTCGCCTEWVSYLQDNGFRVTAHDLDDLSAVKSKYGVDPRLNSCHTAVVDGYVVEGHVPVNDIRRLLSERPNITGISAPGMPQMSPGMHSTEPKDYDVLSFDDKGNIGLFSRY